MYVTMEKYLSWFLGPKAENATVFEDLLKLMVKDYLHWRKNYFPQDKHLISPADNRSFVEEHDNLYQNVNEFLAQMRRNFPFYNPRYIGHMLSDTTIPSMLGYLGGMLYNPNNVTTEAAPVTTEWEIESCNDIAKMIGYKVAPPINSEGFKTYEEWMKYKRKLSDEFSWTHIASGGTLANIEALWVARCVKYLPLSIKEACESSGISIDVKCANGQCVDIKSIDGFTLINIKPNESIYLLSKYISAYIKTVHTNKNTQESAEEAIDFLAKQEHSVSKGLAKLLSEYPLSIYVSGCAHYSWSKAADLLGIGTDNIINVRMTSAFRLDIEDLKNQIKRNSLNNKFRTSPLAVIGILGTTEEGAVDPIDKIDDLRKILETENNISFWFHVDAAWGGYIKSVITLNDFDECKLLANKVNYLYPGKKIYYHNLIDSINNIKTRTLEFINEKKCLNQILSGDIINKLKSSENEGTFKNVDAIQFFFKDIIRKYVRVYKEDKNDDLENIKKDLEILFEILKETFIAEKYIYECNYSTAKDTILSIGNLVIKLFGLAKRTDEITNKNDLKFQITLEDRVWDFANYTNTFFDISYCNESIKYNIRINNPDLIASLLAMSRADSVTIDPHKMGYLPYPCGVISFKNDRIRHFITQKAPYITSAQQNALLHNPPRHYKDVSFDDMDIDRLPTKLSISTDAFATFILEGSKPGAAAAALWLANKTISLDRKGHGEIIKNSLISTHILYTWLSNWHLLMSKAKEPIKYKIIPISPETPDLNLIVFTVMPLCDNIDIKTVNEFVSKVYDKYSIQAELGDDKYSYAQPFFLSKTVCNEKTYKFSMFSDFFKRAGINTTYREYSRYGLVMLRATLMNPYIYPYLSNNNIDLIKSFMISLHESTMNIVNNAN